MKKIFSIAFLVIVCTFVSFGQLSTTLYHLGIYGDIYGKNTLLKQYPIKMTNKNGTNRFLVDSAGNVTAAGSITYNSLINGAGISTIRGLSMGTGQNSQLANLTITKYDGTTVATVDTIGKATFTQLALAYQSTATIGAGDTVQVTVTGITTSAFVVGSYFYDGFLADTSVTFGVNTTNKLTIHGKYNKKVNYVVLTK
jgi:hypothetical protein